MVAAVEVDFFAEPPATADDITEVEDLGVKSVEVIVAALAVVGAEGTAAGSPFPDDDPLPALSCVAAVAMMVVEVARVVVDAGAICNNDTSVFVDLSAVVVVAAAVAVVTLVLAVVGTAALAIEGVAADE